VLAAVEDALGDLDALHELLEPRPVPRLNSWDLNKFKSEYPELMEKVKELKLALRSQIERAKRARGEVGPLQEEIAQRFASLAKEVSEQRAAADLANTELVTERRKAEQRAKTIVELKASIEALSADLTEAKQKVANEGLRANTAEASLRERSEDLQSALSAGEDLRVAKDAAADGRLGCPLQFPHLTCPWCSMEPQFPNSPACQRCHCHSGCDWD
jgi:DNA repair exonuclease SbcCD ATPase subunit